MITLLLGIALAVLGIRIFLGLIGIFGKLSLIFIGVCGLALIGAVIGLVFKLIFAAVPILCLAGGCYLIYKVFAEKQTA
jgi:hypothetical protein